MAEEPMVERVAKALYERAVKTAIEEVEKLVFEHHDLVELVSKLKTESETAQVLIFYSYLDDRIRQLLALHMVDMESNGAKERMFGSNGPLDTFSSRIHMAYHLGWISKETLDRLNAFRKVRNEFAHRAFKVSVTDKIIVDQLKLIDYDIPTMLSGVIDIPDKDKFYTVLPRLVFLAFRTFQELMVFPIAKQRSVSPGSVLSSYDDQPKNARVLAMTFSEALLISGDVPTDVRKASSS